MQYGPERSRRRQGQGRRGWLGSLGGALVSHAVGAYLCPGDTETTSGVSTQRGQPGFPFGKIPLENDLEMVGGVREASVKTATETHSVHLNPHHALPFYR